EHSSFFFATCVQKWIHRIFWHVVYVFGILEEYRPTRIVAQDAQSASDRRGPLGSLSCESRMLLSGICDSLVVPCWTTISSWCNKNLREKQGPIRLRCLPISARETACTLLRAAILFVLAF
ncbi:unnamed protein product, partial [Ascophyllum nodosum]